MTDERQPLCTARRLFSLDHNRAQLCSPRPSRSTLLALSFIAIFMYSFHFTHAHPFASFLSYRTLPPPFVFRLPFVATPSCLPASTTVYLVRSCRPSANISQSCLTNSPPYTLILPRARCRRLRDTRDTSRHT